MNLFFGYKNKGKQSGNKSNNSHAQDDKKIRFHGLTPPSSLGKIIKPIKAARVIDRIKFQSSGIRWLIFKNAWIPPDSKAKKMTSFDFFMEGTRIAINIAYRAICILLWMASGRTLPSK